MSDLMPLDLSLLRAAAASGGAGEAPERAGGGPPGSRGFGSMLDRLVRETDEMQKSSDSAIRELGAGKTDDLHSVMLAMSKADLSFKLMLEVRNKLLEAYQEVMRLQV